MSNAITLLKRALAELIDQDETIRAEFCGMQPWRSPPIIKEIYDYLAAEPEAEPVAYMGTSAEGYPNKFRLAKFAGGIPLYTRPEPTRKPMTEEEEIDAAYDDCIDLEGYYLFEAGVRFAEKHHKIGDGE